MIYFKITTNLFPQPIICDTMSINTDPPHSVYITNWYQYWNDIDHHNYNDKGEINRFAKRIPWHCITSIEIMKGE